jgi:predicted nucleic acid-binding OB-fold protein
MGFRRKGTAVPVAKEETKAAPVKTPAKGSTGGGKKTYHNNALTILEGKDGSLYLQINPKSDIEIKVGGKVVTGMISKDPMVELQESVESGRLTEERAEEIAAKIPEFIKANVTLVTE